MPLGQTLQAALNKHTAGDIAGAAELYRAILAENPEQPDALHMLGVIAQQMGNPERALKLIEASLAKNPGFAQAWHNRCLVLRALGRSDDALQSAREAIALNPGFAEAWDMAGSILREKRRFEDALAYLEKATKLKPGNVQIRTSYAVLLMAMGRIPEAWDVVRKISASDDISAMMAAGNILKSAGMPARAIPWFEKVLAAKPDFPGAVSNKAMAYLQIGDTERGWPLWEKRLENPERRKMPTLQWRGENVRHLLLLEDQGLGDALQCMRYIPLIRNRAEKITLQLTSLLHDLLIPHLPGTEIITLDDPTPAADAAAQLMSLPAILGTKIDTIPADIPYIRAEEKWRAPWRKRLMNIRAPRIGIVWGGNPGNRVEFDRSLAFEQLAPILQTAPGHFVSIQKGPQRDPDKLRAAGVFDAAPFLDNFTDTAGLMAELDLVISICSSPAHLAGAMGRPLWVMLHFDPHWIWLLGREDSPWYPAARLFRQHAPRNWASVTTAVADELRKFLAEDRRALEPKRWAGSPAQENPFAIRLPD